DMSLSGDLQGKGTHVPRRFGRSLLIVRPLGAGSSCAIHRAVERPVQACPQVLHRTAWQRGQDCGMSATVPPVFRSLTPKGGLDPLLALLLLGGRVGVDSAVE